MNNMRLTLREQIKGLKTILIDQGDREELISRKYVAEKLQCILDGTINFHPIILEYLKELRREKKRNKPMMKKYY